MGLAPGSVNSPAGRDSARLTVVFGSAKLPRLSQVAAQAGIAARIVKRTDFILEDGTAISRKKILRIIRRRRTYTT